MTDLLLITDLPRLRKIFSRFSDEKGIRLRIVNNLEKGGEEIVADKPSMVFVQTHLSGLSADILLMHLKKQLGRRRSRFVLLSPPDQFSNETLKLYQGQLDTSLDDNALYDAIRELIASLGPKGKKGAAAEEISVSPPPQLSGIPIPENPDLPALQHPTDSVEPSLEEQGITYSPRSRISVYSEFTSSFDSAVNSMQAANTNEESAQELSHGWNHEEIETIVPENTRSKRTTFILWIAPLLIAVVVVTMIQHSRSNTKPVEIVPQVPVNKLQATSKPAVTLSSAAAGTKQVVEETAPSGTPVRNPGIKPPAAGTDVQSSDKAMMMTIAENRGKKDQAMGGQGAPLLTALPDFIPRSGLDKGYSAANPGWERYKGSVTEFKIYRDKGSIKAIQVIDRGGLGVPESFMKGVLRQLTKKPVFTLEASEKKDGYEIQRGQIAENLKIVFYRDEKGGRLRAFVTTWK